MMAFTIVISLRSESLLFCRYYIPLHHSRAYLLSLWQNNTVHNHIHIQYRKEFLLVECNCLASATFFILLTECDTDLTLSPSLSFAGCSSGGCFTRTDFLIFKTNFFHSSFQRYKHSRSVHGREKKVSH